MDPIEIAKKLIRHEVERGDDCKDIQNGQGGRGSSDWSARVIRDRIWVEHIGRKKINQSFPLKTIYQLIKRESVQPTLFK